MSDAKIAHLKNAISLLDQADCASHKALKYHNTEIHDKIFEAVALIEAKLAELGEVEIKTKGEAL